MLNNIAKVERKLCLKKGLRVKWAWRPVLFRSFSLGIEMNPHMLIVGESGSGKSNASKQIIYELARKGYMFAIFDPHDEYINISKGTNAHIYSGAYSGINIFDLDGMNIKEKSIELTELFRRVFRLGEVQSNMLYKVINYTYNIALEKKVTPSMGSITYYIKAFIRNSSSSKEKLVLDSIEKRFMLAGQTPSKPISIEKVLNSRSIFTLSSLHTSEAQEIYIEGILKKIYTWMLAYGKRSYKFYILIDEIEKLGQSSILARLANEGRKYGIGLIAIAQHAKEVEKSIRGNASLVMSFYQREPEELNYISNMIAGGNELERFSEVKRAIRKLKQGEAIVLSSRREPEIIQFKLFKGSDVASYHIFSLAKDSINEKDLYNRLKEKGFSEEEIKCSISSLLSENILATYHINAPYEGNWYILKKKNSAEHDICVELISRHLEKLGIGNRIYNTSYGPDIVARMGNRRVAVEYESGKKNIGDFMKMLDYRKKYFSRILVITNDSVKERYNIKGLELYNLSEFFSTTNVSIGNTNEY
ncbi:MAG: ATP-binding protein [Candidatus Micrarchaeia archaeon]